MTLRCWIFGHEAGAVPVLREGRVHVKCVRCQRISPDGMPMVTSTKAQPVVYESRTVLRLVKRA